MRILRLGRILVFGWQGLSRNFWLSLIGVVTVALTVMSISVFTVINLALNQARESLEERLDISIFIKEDAAEEDVKAFVSILNQREDTKEVTYVDKQQAEEEFKSLNAGQEELLSVVGELNNPFPRYIQVKTDNPQTLAAVNEFVLGGDFAALVEETSYQQTQEQINGFVNFSKFVLKNSLVISSFFAIISVLVVFNVIRLAIFSRRTEIQIMRYVGASHQLIRLPFVVEGGIMGLLAAVIALILLYGVSAWEAGQIPLYFPGATWNPLQLYRDYFSILLWSNLLLGGGLAASISFLAVRKDLHEK